MQEQVTEYQIVTTLKQVMTVKQIRYTCRELGISYATYCAWKSEYGGLEALDVQPFRHVEAEHASSKGFTQSLRWKALRSTI